MKLNSKTVKSVKSVKATKAVKIKATPKGASVMVVSGSKGQVFRMVSPVDDNGKTAYKLIQNNVGLRYDGPTVTTEDLKTQKLSKETRIELGAYVAAKGEVASLKVVSIEEARKMAGKVTKIMRNKAEITLMTAGKADKHYLASIEKLPNGTEHFFQMETSKLKGKNEAHYGALVR